jgi:hypothetical protein
LLFFFIINFVFCVIHLFQLFRNTEFCLMLQQKKTKYLRKYFKNFRKNYYFCFGICLIAKKEVQSPPPSRWRFITPLPLPRFGPKSGHMMTFKKKSHFRHFSIFFSQTFNIFSLTSFESMVLVNNWNNPSVFLAAESTFWQFILKKIEKIVRNHI